MPSAHVHPGTLFILHCDRSLFAHNLAQAGAVSLKVMVDGQDFAVQRNKKTIRSPGSCCLRVIASIQGTAGP